jgi:hypothetical protein
VPLISEKQGERMQAQGDFEHGSHSEIDHCGR